MARAWTSSLAHLQVFLTIRDAQRRVACVQLEHRPGEWMLPSENCFDGADPNKVLMDILPRWFVSPLAPPRLVQAQNYPPEGGDEHWMVILVYEVEAPAALRPTKDTADLRFFPVGEPPGTMFKEHAAVWANLLP